MKGSSTYAYVSASVNIGLYSEITIPSEVYHGSTKYTVNAVDDNGFEGCTNITKITFPTTLQTIGTEAFGGCTSLTEIEIPATVENIGNRAFYGCTSLKSLAMPACSMGYTIIDECENLENLTLLYSSLQSSADISAIAFYSSCSMNIAVENYAYPKLAGYNDGSKEWHGLTTATVDESESPHASHVSGFTDISTMNDVTLTVDADSDLIYDYSAAGGHKITSIKTLSESTDGWITYDETAIIIDPSKVTDKSSATITVSNDDDLLDTTSQGNVFGLFAKTTGSDSGSSDSGDSGDSGSSDSGSSDDDGDSSGLIIGGAAAAVIVIAAIGLLYFRMHR